MSGYRGLAKNVALLSLSRLGSRTLSFLLVPLYTSVLTTGEYGIYDLVGNSIYIFTPLFTQGIVDAVLRFSIDSERDRPAVLGVGLKWFLLSLFPTVALLVASDLLGMLPQIRFLGLMVFLLYVSQTLSAIVICYAKGLNRFADVAVSSVLCSAITLASNIVFLVVFCWGLTGYFLANIAGPLIQGVFLLVRVKLQGANPLRCDSCLEKEMLAYSRPLIANSIAWWANNAADRYIVTLFCGVASNGVYSVASKISNILYMFQSVFGQAWSISAVEEFDPEDRSGFFSNLYSIYTCVMVLVCSLILIADIPLARYLFAGDFFEAWQYVPFLTIAVVFSASAVYVEGIFAAVKDTKSCAKTTAVGAVSNVAMNFVLVPLIGPLGAAIATAACYCIVWALRMIILRKHIKLRVSLRRDCLAYVLLVVQGSLLLALEPMSHFLMYVAQFVLFGMLVAAYRRESLTAVRKILRIARAS